MKKLGLLIILLNTSIFCLQAQNFEWAKRAGLYAFDLGYGIGTDNAGNVYIAGKYEMNAYFGGTYVTNAGNHDIYVAKYGPTGDFKWVRTAGGTGGDYAHAMTVDGDGNSYVTGEIERTVHFGSVALTSHGSNDIFVAKYDTNGNLLWAKNLGGGTGSDRGLGISQSNGNVYVTGNFQGTAYFPGTTFTSSGGMDIFVAKYSTNGDFQWIKKAGGVGNDEGYSICNDINENIYVTGYFSGTANFSGTSLPSSGGNDIFIAKYDPAGSLLWVKKAGGGGHDYGMSIKVDNSFNVFLTGGFRTNSHFGSITLTGQGGDADIFIARYTSSGDPVWVKKAGGAINDYGRGIALDASSNCYITGNYGLAATFGTTTITGVDSTELYFASYDANGNFRWVLKADGVVDVSDPNRFIEMGLSIATDPSGNVLGSGTYRSSSTFGSTTLQPWSTHTDIYITKIGATSIPPPPPPNDTSGTDCTASGTITRDYWANYTGTTLPDVLFNSVPSSTSERNIFEGPSQAGDYYASRLRGYICPPATGNYTFWIASDNNSELWLSTNNDPANKVKIASVPGYTPSRGWTKYPEQQSAPINLTAGVSYYIEAIHREGTQGDNLAVGWQLPNGSLERPIPGIRLSPFSAAKSILPASGNGLHLSEISKAEITPSKTASYCSGDYVLLKTIESSEYKYQWKKNDRIITGETGFSCKVNSPGSYSVIIINGNDSVSAKPTIVTESKGISVSIAPSDPIFCQDSSTVLITNTGDEFVYEWRRNGVTIPGATSKSYKTDKSGDYQVKIIQGSCFDWSGITNVSLRNCSKTDSILNRNNPTLIGNMKSPELKDDSLLIRIYPNPNGGLFTLEINMVYLTSKVDLAKIEVLNGIGQIVFHKLIPFNKGYINDHIELENSIPPGIYFLQVTIGDKVEKNRMLLTK